MKLLKINWQFLCLLLIFFLTFNFPVFATSSYTYTGSSTLIDDGNGKYRIKFLTSGTFTPANNIIIDAFLVGGGGGGACGGGGGGYTKTTENIVLEANNSYEIVVGEGGDAGQKYSSSTVVAKVGQPTSAFGDTVLGGYNGGTTFQSRSGGNGGSGGGGGAAGAGGSNGSNGTTGSGSYPAGSGQGQITREFDEASGTLYAGGGGGEGGSGGVGGGGNGTCGTGESGVTNTGGGGGGTCSDNYYGGAGGSGIVIIRFTDSTPPTINSITADQELATASGESVTLTVSGLADTGGSGLASLKYSYFVPGSSSWNQVTIANTSSSASFAIPITKEGTYYIKAVAIDSASNLSNEVETSIFINRGTFTASPSPSPVPSFTKPLQIKDIAKGSYVSFNNYLFVKLGNIGESGPFLAVSPLCEQPLVLTSSGILDDTNTIYTGNLPTPGQTTVALVSSPDSSMHGTCTWSSTTNPSLSSITSYLDSNHCIANLNTSTTTSYTVSMTGCLTNPATSLTVSLAEFAGE